MSAGIPADIYCRHCGNLMDSTLAVCPHCGVRNQYAQPATGGSVSYQPDHGLATTTQAITGLKGGLYASLSGLVLTSILFVVSLLNNLKEIPAMVKSIPAVSGAVAGGAVLRSPGVAAGKFLGWVFFGANFVSVEASAAAGETTRTTTSNVVTALGKSSSLEPVLFHAIPVLLLVVFGYTAARSVGYWRIHENVAAGASVAIGYVLFALVGATFGTIAFGADVGPSASVGPPLGQSVLVFGLLGCLCGGLGGLVRHLGQNG